MSENDNPPDGEGTWYAGRTSNGFVSEHSGRIRFSTPLCPGADGELKK